jgi:CBS domain-containing protein
MTLTAKDFMSKGVFTVKDDDTLLDAAKEMAKRKVSSLVVINKKKEIVGMITERDMLRDVLAKKKNLRLPVKDVLSSPINKVDAEADVLILSRYLVNNKIKRLIVTKENKMVGILTQTDMLRASIALIHDIDKKLEKDDAGRDEHFEKVYEVFKNLDR